MSWADALENINLLAVLAGTVIALLIGATWYAPQGFGKQWMNLIGFKKKDMERKDGMAVMMTFAVVFYFAASLVIGLLYEMTGAEGAGDGVLLGAILGFVFGFGPMTVSNTFARRRFDLSLIDGGYIVVCTAAIGAIIGLMS